METEDIKILETNDIWYKKVRNGLWRVMKGSKKISEHSMESGARAMCLSLLQGLRKETTDLLKDLTTAIISVNPEIVELKEGCKIRVDDNDIYTGAITTEQESHNCICTVLWYSKGGFNGEDYDGDTLMVFSPDWAITQTFGDGENVEMPKYETLGRDITLEDVLVAIYKKTAGSHIVGEGNYLEFTEEERIYLYEVNRMWKLNTPLQDQSPDLIEFLHKVICSK